METLTPQQMDEAAELAMKELGKLPQTCYIPVARWFRNHFMRAGHKRLGRGLVQIAKATEKLPETQWTTPEDVKEEPTAKVHVLRKEKKNGTGPEGKASKGEAVAG